jgi:hypothetical protein
VAYMRKFETLSAQRHGRMLYFRVEWSASFDSSMVFPAARQAAYASKLHSHLRLFVPA